jgi:hypothetical protein
MVVMMKNSLVIHITHSVLPLTVTHHLSLATQHLGAWSEETLRKWMDDRKLPLLSELDAGNFEVTYFDPPTFFSLNLSLSYEWFDRMLQALGKLLFSV